MIDESRYHLGAISDGQTLWAKSELQSVGLAHFFDPVLVSGDFGYRKPDQRLFEKALELMQLEPDEVIYIGNDIRVRSKRCLHCRSLTPLRGGCR